MENDSVFLSQEYILSDLEIQLSRDLQINKLHEDRIILKHIPSKSYMIVTADQLALLRRFRLPTATNKMIPDLISDRKCPPLRELYELILQGLKAGILQSAQIEPNFPNAIASDWNLKLHFKLANAFALICILFGTLSLAFSEIALPTNLIEMVVGYVTICLAISSGYFLSACLLRGFDHEVYDFGINWKHLFPHFFCDISDAQMSDRYSEATVALSQVAPLFLVVGIGAYWFPSTAVVLVLGLFQITQPYRNSSGWLFLESLFKKKSLSIHAPPIFNEARSYGEKLKSLLERADRRFIVASTSYTIIWIALFLLSLLSFANISIEVLLKNFLNEGYYRNFAIFIATVTFLFIAYSIFTIFRSKPEREAPRKIIYDLPIKSRREPGLSQNNVTEFLKQCLLFEDLEDDVLREIADRMEIRFYRKKQYIYHEGEQGGDLHVIARGRVETLMSLKSGRHIKINELTTSEIFAEKSAIFETAHSRSIRALTQTDCLVLSGSDFKELVVEKLGFKKVRTIIEKHYFMHRIPLCKEWTRETIAQFSHLSTFARYQIGESILKKGLGNKFFFIVYDGILEARDGTKVLNQLTTGDFFGEISLLQNSVCVADVVAVTETRCLIVSRMDFLSMIGKDYRFGLQFERISSERLKHPIFPLKGVNYSDAAIGRG